MIVKFVTILLFGCASVVTTAQNLVPNPSFEANTGCPREDRQIELVTDWWSPFGSPCYFHDCNNYQTEYRRLIAPGEKRYDEVPALPHSGKAYVGINVSGVIYPGFQDYLMTQLKDSLKKDSTYQISMYVRLGDVWRYMEHVDVYFSKEKYPVSRDQVIDYGVGYEKYGPRFKRYNKRVSLIFKEDTVSLRNDTLELNIQDHWMKIEGEYCAKGGEKYITIGKFNGVRETWDRILPQKNKTEYESCLYTMFSYYFIDDVSVTKIPLHETRAYKAFANTIEPGKNIVLENIYFKTGEATLQATSFPALKLLLTYMQANTSLSLEVHGHTDDVGNEEANRKLSQDRAASILNYLLDNGIYTTRLVAKGFGSEQPVADNATEAGRQQNRRVEFTIH